MLTYVAGDVFLSPAQVLVNTVNTVGVMGKGIAQIFRDLYPEMYTAYRDRCQRGAFDVGQLWLYRTPHKWILNFPTKKHWRDPSLLDYIETGLQVFVATYADQGMTSASFPLLGSGLGQLDWATQVRPLMEHYLAPLPINIYVHFFEPENLFTPSDNDVLRQWLHGQTQMPDQTRFRQDMLAVLRSGSVPGVAGDAAAFRLLPGVDDRHFTLRYDDDTRLVLSMSMLTDVWGLVRSAGYVLPQALPSELVAHAPALIDLFAALDYVYPVYGWRPGEARQVGLHFVPPAADAVPVWGAVH